MNAEKFHNPDHDHAQCTRELLERAARVCETAGARLTPLRRRVLRSVAENHRATGAYDLIDRLAESGPRPAPISIYRALDFLVGLGLVHKIECRNAFVACCHGEHEGNAVLMICDGCGVVCELDAGDELAQLASRARQHGFAPRHTITELTGACAACVQDGC